MRDNPVSHQNRPAVEAGIYIDIFHPSPSVIPIHVSCPLFGFLHLGRLGDVRPPKSNWNRVSGLGLVKVPSTKLIALIYHYHPSIILQSGSGFGIETCSNSQSHSTA